MILGYVNEAVQAEAREKACCELIGISQRCLQRWRKAGIGDDGRTGSKSPPKNQLSQAERTAVLKELNSPRFCGLSPWQIVAQLADEERYLCSESTMYRILREEGLQNHRERSRTPVKRHRPRELVATAPNQVWTWDITHMASAIRGQFYKCYVIIDIFSRKIIGRAVHDRECSEFAARMIEIACLIEGVDQNQLVIHSDNGAPMKGATLLAKLHELGVATSYSRPSVSNDNPFSESIFRTAKYRPWYPAFFATLEAAREWTDRFVVWYNTMHRHSGIKYVTPEQRHLGDDVAILKKREKVYAEAKARNPERWSGKERDWRRIEEVRLNPEDVGGGMKMVG